MHEGEMIEYSCHHRVFDEHPPILLYINKCCEAECP